MSNYVKIAAETGDRYLAAVAENQENFLKLFSAFSSWAPKPVLSADFSGLRKVTAASFEFSEKLLEQQRAFTERLLDATLPEEADATLEAVASESDNDAADSKAAKETAAS